MSFLNKYAQTLFLYLLSTVVVVGAIVVVIFILEEKNTQAKQDETIAKQDEAIRNQGYVLSNITANSGQNAQIQGLVRQVISEDAIEDKKNLIEETFFGAFMTYQNKILIKELAKELGLKNFTNTPLINKTYYEYPHYEANRTHLSIVYDDNGNRTVMEIPEPFRNLVNPFHSNITNNGTKASDVQLVDPHAPNR